MMTKKKTSRWIGVKFALALPAIALLLFAFAEPNYRAKDTQTENQVSTIQKGEKQFTIHGKVLDEKNKEPLPGASIVIKGTSIGTVSDIDGTFTLVDPNPKVDQSTGALSSKVVISFVGLKTIENEISASGTATDNASFTFSMEDNVILIDNNTYIGAIPPPPPPKTELKNDKSVPPPPPPPSVDGEKEVFYVVEDMPQYPGGHEALQEYVSKMQQKLAKEKGLKGKAKVDFTVTGKGKISNINIVEQENDGVGKGAVSIVSGMENWTPGKQRGKAVSVKYLLPVEFK